MLSWSSGQVGMALLMVQILDLLVDGEGIRSGFEWEGSLPVLIYHVKPFFGSNHLRVIRLLRALNLVKLLNTRINKHLLVLRLHRLLFDINLLLKILRII